jgi:hypothetical protein
MVRVFDSLRREQQRQQMKSPVTSVKNKSLRVVSSDRKGSQRLQQKQSTHHSLRQTRPTESTSGQLQDVLTRSNELSSNLRIHSPCDTGVFSSESSTTDPERSHPSDSRKSSGDQNNDSRRLRDTRTISSNEASSSSSSSTERLRSGEGDLGSDSKADDVIFGLRKQIIVLKKQVQDKESAYLDLLQKYNDRKEQHKESIKRMRSVGGRRCFIVCFLYSLSFSGKESFFLLS